MQGMTKGSGTRSGLLWEVERLLNETENLPQVLMMENVPQVHSEENMPDFQAWIDFLSSKGYVNYWQDLNAKDYGVAQNRNRCIMVSLLGEYNFKFPTEAPLTKNMKEYLEPKVDKKFYITSKKAQLLIDTLIENGTIPGNDIVMCVDGTLHQPGEIEVANCIKARYDEGISKLNKVGSMVCEMNKGIIVKNMIDKDKEPSIELTDCACSLLARDYKGLNNYGSNAVLVIGKMDNTLDNTFESANRVYDTNGICPTIPTCSGGNIQPKILEIKIRQATKEGFIDCEIGGVADLEYPNSKTRRGRVINRGNISPTLTTESVPSLIEFGDPDFYNFVYEIEGEIYLIRIRKLTPRECWRLMGFSDADYENAAKHNSASQLYKQAGNSIVKNVLMAVFKQIVENQRKMC